LIPVEVKVVDRDDPKKQWGDEKAQSSDKPIYAGESTGDMVSWKLGGTDIWSSAAFTWTAKGPNGESKAGPTGAGKNEWKIANGDGDTENNQLNWQPGKWKIKVQIGSSTVEFEQEVGWRTDDYVVIGQIVPTHTHDGDAPPLVAVGDNFWEISSPVVLYRRAVLYDILDVPVFASVTAPIRDLLMITPLPITAKLTEVWFLNWSLMNSGNTPAGPFTSAHLSGTGSVQRGHRLWALQHMLNVSPDTPAAPSSFTPEVFDGIKDDNQYRVIHRSKNKFVTTTNGKIDPNKVVQIQHVAGGGPTKMKVGFDTGEIISTPWWSNPAVTLFDLGTEPSHTNQYHDKFKVSADGTKLSYYATGRVGAGGQNANWRLFGKDAPWIFSEVIMELKSDRSVDTSVKTSVNTSWSESGGRQGHKPFNNLNIYKAVVEQRSDGSFKITFMRKDLLEMEGSLEAFINSASGLRPEPAIPPSVQ
ncbi:MAG: hypothetical protein WCK17_11010, partial [Verrucomicrobiota bacterium]